MQHALVEKLGETAAIPGVAHPPSDPAWRAGAAASQLGVCWPPHRAVHLGQPLGAFPQRFRRRHPHAARAAALCALCTGTARALLVFTLVRSPGTTLEACAALPWPPAVPLRNGIRRLRLAPAPASASGMSPREHGGSNALLIRWSSVSTLPATAAITPAGASADAEDSVSEKELLQLVHERLGARLVPVHAMLEELGELLLQRSLGARDKVH